MFFSTTRTPTPFLLLFVLLWGGLASDPNVLRINTTEDLIVFSKNVNMGTTYIGTTVLLDSDMAFSPSTSQQFAPIGNTSIYFRGTFDGQGHSITNLALVSNYRHVGLFGCSYGAVFRNVVIDGSCSMTSRDCLLDTDLGGLSSYCTSCTIENSVNMATLIFTQNVRNFRMGGFIGRGFNDNIIKNCVNFGSLIQYGTTVYSNIGGIAGLFLYEISGLSIQNCANYGQITLNGTATEGLKIGGILGVCDNLTIVFDNCLSAGNINSNGDSYSTAAILGQVSYNVTAIVNHCMWTSDVGYNMPYGYNRSVPTISDSSLVVLNDTTMNELNDYAEKNDTYSKWFILRPHLDGGRINNNTQEIFIVPQGYFPEPVKEGYTFLFWCKDDSKECAEKYDPKASMTGVTDLYAQWAINNYTVTFDFNNGTESEAKVLDFNETINYPAELVREGYTFDGWSPNPERMPAHDLSVTAEWIINNYTATFDFCNGTVLICEFPFDSAIGYPGGSKERDGYTFDGWSPNPERMPAHDLNLTAQWVQKPTEYVEIVFGKKDLKEEDAEEILRGYTQEKFKIIRFETDEDTGDIIAIIKFEDKEKASDFVRSINEYRRPEDNFIKVVRPASDYEDSSLILAPSFFLFLFFVI